MPVFKHPQILIASNLTDCGVPRRLRIALDPKAAATGWIILTLFGLGSALSLWFYNRWLQKQS